MSRHLSARAVSGPRASLFSLSGTCLRPIRNTAAAEPVSAESPVHPLNAADAGLSADCLRDAAGSAPSQPLMRPTPSQGAFPKAVFRRHSLSSRPTTRLVAPAGMVELCHGAG